MTDNSETKAAAERLGSLLASAMHAPLDAIPRFDSAPKLLLACMPKSGSTWITRVLSESLALPMERAYYEGGHNEQEIDFVQIARTLDREVLFVQQHLRGSEPTLRLCRAANIKVVVLTRNILDCMVSFYDHILQDSPVAPMFFIEREWFAALSETDRYDFLIDHCFPWYANFLMTWLRFSETWGDLIHFARYEDVTADPEAALREIAAWSGAGTLSAAPVTKVEGNTRFNQGKIGRAQSAFSAEQIARAHRMFRYYPNALGYSHYAFAGS